MDLSDNRVGFVPCKDYNVEQLAALFDSLHSSCSGAGQLRGARVLLKPNLISNRSGPLSCTEGAFILAAAKWFIKQGSMVSVGDSPAFGTASSVLARIGVKDQLTGLGVGLADFSRTVTVRLPSGIEVGMAAEALECDLLVNLPRVKAHSQLRLTLAVKNYFGCIAGMRKPLWHMVHGGSRGRFERHVAELLLVLPDSLTFIDGITAMHRSGPVSGEPYPLGLVGCSANPVALDRALLDVLGVAPADSPLMQACAELGLPGTDLSGIVFPLSRPDELAVDDFEVPADLAPVRFNPFRFLRGGMRRMLLRLSGR